MSNIYDEALESIDKLEISKEYLFQPVLETIIKALERAKKMEELLGLYKRLYNVCKEYKHTSIGLSDDSEFINTMNNIEEELK